VNESTTENRRLRGGNWLNYAADQHTSSSPLSVSPDYENNNSFGLRVASVIPEPSTCALFGIGAIGLLFVMRGQKTA